ncbi:MAG: tRNA (adenosine(37)-N6)-dimethylallyltransferase MiaA [Ignavibacterium sp.]|nr:tRNA (adenosine(37)-N6)-dimethylallyltransferase MiaA [Ignavibacterium sp.]
MGQVIVIAGPTCSGKTNLAIRVAERINSEIISADSRQVYKYLNIGTAKPSKAELKKVKHHLIDHTSPDGIFNAGMFVDEAERIISRLHLENKIPVVAGGTGLYIKSLIDGIINSVDTNMELRDELLRKRKQFGNEFLYNELKRVDPKSADSMLPQNWKRVIRALEVFYISGKPIWWHFDEQIKNSDNYFFQFGIDWDRTILYERIEKRVDIMIENGLVYEVTELINKGYSKQINSLNTVGYKEIISYLENEISLMRAVELIKRNTRRYAKRQITWFKADNRIDWINVKSEADILEASNFIIKKVLNERKN